MDILVRSLSRSRIGIGKQLLSSTADVTVDIDDPEVRRDLLKWHDQIVITSVPGAADFSDIIDGAPAALDTLNELAAALDDDENFASTVAGLISDAQSAADDAQQDIDDHVADATAAHASSAIGYDNTISGLAATQVKAAIDELAAASGGVQLGDNNTWTGTNEFQDELKVDGTTNGFMTFDHANVYFFETDASSAVIGGEIDGDASQRWGVKGDGSINLGGGAAPFDVSVGRSEAGVFKIGAGQKFQQNSAPTTGDDLTNKTYVDSVATPKVVSLIQSAPQSIPDGVFTAIQWNDEVADASGFHSGSSADVTVPASMGGLYRIDATVQLAAPSPGDDCTIRVLVNGAPITSINHFWQGAGDLTLSVPSRLSTLSPSDVVTVEVKHNEGAPLNTAIISTYMSMERVA